jgi:hypothetical protein
MNRVDTVVAGGRVVVAGGRVTTEVIGVGAGERLPVVVG